MHTMLTTGFRDLLHDLLFALVLVPKTIFKISTNPAWICPYVGRQFKNASDVRFRDYTHPILLFLFAAVAPLVVLIPLLAKVLPGIVVRSINIENIFRLHLPDDFFSTLAEGCKIIDNLSIYTKLIFLFAMMASWPIAASLAIHLIRFKPLTASALRPVLYAQCYFFSVVFCYFSLYSIIWAVHNEPLSLTTQYIFMMLPLLYFAWGQLVIIRALTSGRPLKVLCTLFLVFVFAQILTVLFEVIFFFPICIWHFTHLQAK